MAKLRVRVIAVSSILVLLAAASVGTASAGGGGSGGGRNGRLPNVDQNFEPSGPLTASAPGITEDTIKIGYITSQTGVAASSFEGGDQGARARAELQNDQGGINGRQIEVIAVDDGQIGNETAARNLVENEDVFAVIDFSAFTIQGAPYLQEQGVPVVGAAFDGPEWGQEPYSNMFTYMPPIYTPFDGTYYIYDTNARFLKQQGVTKLAGLGFDISQSSTQNIKGTFAAAAERNIEECYQNLSVQFGQTSFTTEALAIQQDGCDGVVGAMTDSSNVGLAASLAQAGLQPVQFYYTGYNQAILDDPNAAAALEGAFFPAAPNFTNPTKGVRGMLAALEKYAPDVEGIPNLGVYGSYLAMDVMIEGLRVAGENPTRESFITELRKVTGYRGPDNLFPAPGLSFTGFGTVDMFPERSCNDFVQLVDGKYKTVKRNVCGKLVSYPA